MMTLQIDGSATCLYDISKVASIANVCEHCVFNTRKMSNSRYLCPDMAHHMGIQATVHKHIDVCHCVISCVLVCQDPGPQDVCGYPSGAHPNHFILMPYDVHDIQNIPYIHTYISINTTIDFTLFPSGDTLRRQSGLRDPKASLP